MLINTGAFALLQRDTLLETELWRKSLHVLLAWLTFGGAIYFLGGAATSDLCRVGGASSCTVPPM